MMIMMYELSLPTRKGKPLLNKIFTVHSLTSYFHTFRKSGSSKLISVPLWSSSLLLCARFRPSYSSVTRNRVTVFVYSFQSHVTGPVIFFLQLTMQTITYQLTVLHLILLFSPSLSERPWSLTPTFHLVIRGGFKFEVGTNFAPFSSPVCLLVTEAFLPFTRESYKITKAMNYINSSLHTTGNCTRHYLGFQYYFMM